MSKAAKVDGSGASSEILREDFIKPLGLA